MPKCSSKKGAFWAEGKKGKKKSLLFHPESKKAGW